MSTLKFSDGIDIDTSGPIRTLKLKDGWYVVGGGMLIPVINENEAKIIADDLVYEENNGRQTMDDKLVRIIKKDDQNYQIKIGKRLFATFTGEDAKKDAISCADSLVAEPSQVAKHTRNLGCKD